MKDLLSLFCPAKVAPARHNSPGPWIVTFRGLPVCFPRLHGAWSICHADEATRFGRLIEAAEAAVFSGIVDSPGPITVVDADSFHPVQQDEL